MTRRSGDRIGPSPAAHAEARVQAVSDRIQADTEDARALLRELHEAVKDGRQVLRALQQEQAAAQKWGDALRDEAQGAIRAGLFATVERQTESLNAHFEDGLRNLVKQMADLRLEAIASGDPGQARRWIKDALKRSIENPDFLDKLAGKLHLYLQQDDDIEVAVGGPGAAPVKVRLVRAGEQPGLYLGDV